MKSITTAHASALAGVHTFVWLVEIDIGSNTYYLTNEDFDRDYGGHTYLAGYLIEVGDIEVTSEPKINEITPIIDCSDGAFKTLILSQSWMNKPFKATQLTLDGNGDPVGDWLAFEGFLSEFSIENSEASGRMQWTLNLSVTSIWADFEKVSGIRTNLASQQRYYPNDTGFRHAANAAKDVPWGREGPSNSGDADYPGLVIGDNRFPYPEDLP